MWLAIVGAWVVFSLVFFAVMMYGTWLVDRNLLRVEWADEVDDALF